MQIPTYLEKLIHEGKATYKSLSMGACQTFVIPVPKKSYIIIFGYEYLPIAPYHMVLSADVPDNAPFVFNRDQVQFVTFLNQSNFFTYSHYLNYRTTSVNSRNWMMRDMQEMQKRSCYIVAKENIAVYFTRLNQANLVINQNVLQNNPPIQTILGYGNLNAATQIIGYNNVVDTLQPLTTPYTVPTYHPNPSNFNQLSTGLDAQFAPLDLTSLQIEGSRGQSRANLMVAHYVEVFTEAPENLI